MRWLDIYDIAIELENNYPDVNINNVRFTDLRNWVVSLPGFNEDPNKCNEKILEAIQAAWIEERE